jgi:hypothetical protein
MLVTFMLYDSNGNPLTGISPSFYTYCSAVSGTNLPNPTISPVGNGFYYFQVTGSELQNEGFAYVIDGTASASPRYSAGADGNNGVVGFGIYESDAPFTGDTPTFSTYEDYLGNSRTAPTINHMSGVYTFVPTAADRAAGTTYEIVTNHDPTRIYGFLEQVTNSSAPTVSVISPSVGSSIYTDTHLVINVTDDFNSFKEIRLWAAFSGMEAIELVYDGSSFTSLYSVDSTRSVISNGFQFSLMRRGGWPGSPTITASAIDTNGGENP